MYAGTIGRKDQRALLSLPRSLLRAHARAIGNRARRAARTLAVAFRRRRDFSDDTQISEGYRDSVRGASRFFERFCPRERVRNNPQILALSPYSSDFDNDATIVRFPPHRLSPARGTRIVARRATANARVKGALSSISPITEDNNAIFDLDVATPPCLLRPAVSPGKKRTKIDSASTIASLQRYLPSLVRVVSFPSPRRSRIADLLSGAGARP